MCTVAPGWVQHYKVVPATNVYCSTWLSSTLQGRTSHKCVLEHLTEFNTTRSYQPQMCTVAPDWVQHYKVVPATNVYCSLIIITQHALLTFFTRHLSFHCSTLSKHVDIMYSVVNGDTTHVAAQRAAEPKYTLRQHTVEWTVSCSWVAAKHSSAHWCLAVPWLLAHQSNPGVLHTSLHQELQPCLYRHTVPITDCCSSGFCMICKQRWRNQVSKRRCYRDSNCE